MATSACSSEKLADLIRSVLVLIKASITGLFVGWSIDSSIGEAAAGYGILLLFAFAMIWVGAWVGLHMPSPEVATRPVWSGCSVDLPVQRVRPVGRHAEMATGDRRVNPISSVCWPPAPVRQSHRHSRQLVADDLSIPFAIGWSLLILAVCIPLSVRRFRRTTSK